MALSIYDAMPKIDQQTFSLVTCHAGSNLNVKVSIVVQKCATHFVMNTTPHLFHVIFLCRAKSLCRSAAVIHCNCARPEVFNVRPSCKIFIDLR